MIVSKCLPSYYFSIVSKESPSFFTVERFVSFFSSLKAKYYVVEKERMAQSILYIVVFFRTLYDRLPFGICAIYSILGGGFKYFLFSPLFGEDFQFD